MVLMRLGVWSCRAVLPAGLGDGLNMRAAAAQASSDGIARHCGRGCRLPAASSIATAGWAATRATSAAARCAPRRPCCWGCRAAGRAAHDPHPADRPSAGPCRARSACPAGGSSRTMTARRRRRCARRWRRSASPRPRSSCWAACATTTPSPAFASTRSSAGSSRRWSYTPDPFEVAEVFELPLSFVAGSANHRRDSYERNGERRHFYVLPYQDRYIWGATAGILVNFARLLDGLSSWSRILLEVVLPFLAPFLPSYGYVRLLVTRGQRFLDRTPWFVLIAAAWCWPASAWRSLAFTGGEPPGGELRAAADRGRADRAGGDGARSSREPAPVRSRRLGSAAPEVPRGAGGAGRRRAARRGSSAAACATR